VSHSADHSAMSMQPGMQEMKCFCAVPAPVIFVGKFEKTEANSLRYCIFVVFIRPYNVD